MQRPPIRLAKPAAFILAILAGGCVAGDSDDELAAETQAAAESAASPLSGSEQNSLVTNPRRSLIETNKELLAPLTLGHVFSFAASNNGLTPLPELTHNLFFNLYNDSSTDVFQFGEAPFPHRPCDHPLYQGLLNNFPFQCRRSEGNFAVASVSSAPEMANWKAIALVNRIDLAPATGEHCGEQRLVVARSGGGFQRDFIIFEAQIPNPDPSRGSCACAPIADFWLSLEQINDVPTRQLELAQAFFFGHPSLLQQGFGPFISAANLTIGTGQVRTNNFDQFPWTLREHKLVESRGVIFPLPFPVAANLHAPLLQDNSTHPNAAKCQQAFIDSVPSLVVDDLNLMALNVPPECWDAESPNDNSQGNYLAHMGSQVAARVQTKLNQLGSNLTPTDIANRASFAGSCIGCHVEMSGQNLGNGVTFPGVGFVHVDERDFALEDCGDGTQCFRVSQPLSQHFLPHRQTVMSDFLNSCGGGLPEKGSTPLPTKTVAKVKTLDNGEPDFAALKKADQDSKPKSTTLGGTPTSRTH